MVQGIAKGAALCAALVAALATAESGAAEIIKPEIIKLGLSVPLSGIAANWGKGAEWLCKRAAEEIAAGGGVVVANKTYNFECVAYDNKFNAADGAKVAQTLLNRDGIKFIAGALGTAPVRALQSLSERNGVLLFTTAWGISIKGPNFPLTFTQMNTPNEFFRPLIGYVQEQNPAVRTVALLNPNDATGQESEPVARKSWEALGVKVVSSDWYERGTTEFQPIAGKIAASKADVVDISSAPPGEAKLLFKELNVLGWKGVKVAEAANETLAGGEGTEGVYLGAAISFDSVETTERQRAANAGAQAAIGEPLNTIQIGFYDSVMAIKAGMEKAQSVDPRAVAAALPQVSFQSLYGPSAFGGREVYGTPQQMLLPVIVSQIKDGKLVELKRLQSDEMRKHLVP